MPSPDAVLGTASIPEMAPTYEELSYDMDEFGMSMRATKIPNFGRLMMGREFTSSIVMMQMLGIEIDKNSAIMRFLRTMLVSNMAIFGFYRMVLAVRRIVASQQLGFASAETAIALSNPFTAWKVPVALGAAAFVVGSFRMGEAFGTGEWSFPAVDISTPTDRRKAERHLRGVRRG